MRLTHEEIAKHARVVTLGRVRLFFSYDSLIAYELDGEGCFDPTYRGLSSTTSRHATATGCAGFPTAEDGPAFDAGLRAALKEA